MREQLEKSMSPEPASQAERAQAIAWIFGSKGPCAALIQAETEAEALDLGSRAAGMLGEGAKAVFAPVGPGLEDAGKRQVAAWALEAAGQGKVALVCARLGDERMEAIARASWRCACWTSRASRIGFRSAGGPRPAKRGGRPPEEPERGGLGRLAAFGGRAHRERAGFGAGEDSGRQRSRRSRSRWRSAAASSSG